MRKILSFGLAAVLAGTVIVPTAADAAVVICQRKNKLKLRVDACSAKETQVDAAELGVVGPEGPAGTTALWAVVEADGTLARGSGVTSSANSDPGAYEVIFNRDVTTCAYVASLGLSGSLGSPDDGSIGVVGRFENANGVYLVTRNGAGTEVNHGFHVAVFCP